MSLEIVSRADWGARPPKNTPRIISVPTPELWLHHTASPTGEAARVRSHQNYHMDVKGWNDIAYSFLINHEGTIYMGRGPGVAGGHTAGHNTISHAICLMGNFNTTQPTVAALTSLKELVRHGFVSGWWPETLTGGHRDTRGSEPKDCPGDNLYKLIPEINDPEDVMTPAQEAKLDAVLAAVQPSSSWSATVGTGDNKQTLASVLVESRNLSRTILAALVAPEATVNLTDADLTAIAEAVADEQHRRQAE